MTSRSVRRARLQLETLEDRLALATINVTTFADVVNASDGKVSLREAITQANARPGADTIVLPAGIYRLALRGSDNSNAGGDLDVTGSTLFRGAGAGNTIIDGQRLDRVFDVLGTAPSSIAVTFQSLTIRNGFDNLGGGGGILVGNADLVVRDCVVTGNRTSSQGGGISNATLPGTGNVTLVGAVVNRNVAAGEGGGLFVQNNVQGQVSVLNVSGSRIQRNFGGNGGGIAASTVNLTSSIVTGNSANNSGGGIEAGTANLTNSTVSGNSCDNQGGGIHATTATLTNSTVSDNSASDVGGGIAANTATLINSTVSGNFVGSEGGGIAAGTVALTRSSVRGNIALRDNAGGILATTAMLTDSTVSGNSARNMGGGILATTATLTNSTVSGNSAIFQGGGILATSLTLLNVTITENSSRAGSGVFLRSGGASSVRNSIIAQNLSDIDGLGSDLAGAFTSGGHNLIGNATDATGFANGINGDMAGTAVNPIDPMLAPLAKNGGPAKNHALLAGSPAIDHGDNNGAPTTDQRGVGRPRDGDGNGSQVVDIGAFER